MSKHPILCVSMTLAVMVFGASVRGSHAADKAAADKKAPAAAKAEDKTAKAKAEPAAVKAEPGEVTLKGELTCAKCGLHEAKECQNVLKVKDAGGKETKYYVAKNAVADESHKKICKGALLPATVTGKVGEEGGKKVITPSALKVD